MSRPNTFIRARRGELSRRAGFSLIEILVVIGLIAFLTAALVAVIPRVGNAAKVASTKATIKKVDEMLNDRVNGFRRWIQKQDQAGANTVPQYVVTAEGLTNGSVLTQSGLSVVAQKALAQKLLFQAYFPQTYQEMINSPYFASLFQALVPVWAANTAYVLGQAVQAGPGSYFYCTVPGTSGGTQPAWPSATGATVTDGSVVWTKSSSGAQSAACLYVILTQAPLFDTEPPSAADLKALELADTDHDGIPEVVDAWGHGLRFYRWPTRLVRPNGPPSGSSTGFVESTSSPLSILMPGAAPRGPVASWQASHPYNVGQTVLSGAAVATNFMVMYRCVTAGTSGSGTPSPWPAPPVVGSSFPPPGPGDGGVTWQVLIDPLSVDPDDPLGLIPAGLVNESTTETPNTWSTPLILSTARDDDSGATNPSYQFGLFEPQDTTHLGNLAQPQTPPPTPDALYGIITNHQQ
jgi:prepilin-type N-terminal cleavage/methylation domain-containing protein